MKSTSLTPETDALAGEWIACECVPASHSRKLERERDEAHELFARLRDRIAELEGWVEEGKRNGARCAEQRDRLQDAVRNLRDVKGRHNTGIAYERLLAMLPENA
jgi:hypothetical protein